MNSKSMAPKKGVKKARQPKWAKWLLAAVAVIAVAFAVKLGHTAVKAQPYIKALETRAATIQAEMDESSLSFNLASGTPSRVVSISVSDGQKTARTFWGTGEELEPAWNDALSKAKTYLTFHPMNPEWVKGDVVIRSQVTDGKGVLDTIDGVGMGAFRCGIASDTKYSTALLETQVVASQAVSYTPATLNWNKAKEYASKIGVSLPKHIPEQMVLFQTAGWIVEGDGPVTELYGDTAAYGSRVIDGADLTKEDIKAITAKAASYLVKTMADDGTMQYKYIVGTGEIPDDYDMVRYSATLWSMTEEYKATHDEALGDAIKKGALWLKARTIPLTIGDGVVFIGDRDGNLCIGTSGFALLAYTNYIEEFGEDVEINITFCREIADALLSLQERDGSFQQILNRDMTKGEKFASIYYEGEAAFGLCRFYGLAKDQKYLDAGKKAADNYIRNNYLSEHDHWASYFFNELTKYSDEPRYYEFAMRNILDVKAELLGRSFTPTRLEMIMAGYETCRRMEERGIEIEYQCSSSDFKDLAVRGVEAVMVGRMLPEFAMYMAKPQEILGTFFWRGNEGIYVQTDGIQHSILGLIQYMKYMEDLVE